MNEDKGCDYVHDWSNANIASFSRYLQESNIVNNMQGKNIDNNWDLFKNLVQLWYCAIRNIGIFTPVFIIS